MKRYLVVALLFCLPLSGRILLKKDKTIEFDTFSIFYQQQKNKNKHSGEKSGSLEVICGSMFSGKSEELIRRIRRAHIAKRECAVFKHGLDNRYIKDKIASHNENTIQAHVISEPKDIIDLTDNKTTEIIAIDEAQFFDSDQLIHVVTNLVSTGKRVIVAGLDLDFKGEPFGCMPQLMALADEVTKLKAICSVCGQDAYCSQRIIDGKPARYTDPLIVVGAQETYQARCRKCHIVTK